MRWTKGSPCLILLPFDVQSDYTFRSNANKESVQEGGERRFVSAGERGGEQQPSDAT